MADLRCPRCGLTERRRRGAEAEVWEAELCPRCLARTAGVLSIRLQPAGRTTRPQSGTREVIARLTRRVRAEQAK